MASKPQIERPALAETSTELQNDGDGGSKPAKCTRSVAASVAHLAYAGFDAASGGHAEASERTARRDAGAWPAASRPLRRGSGQLQIANRGRSDGASVGLGPRPKQTAIEGSRAVTTAALNARTSVGRELVRCLLTLVAATRLDRHILLAPPRDANDGLLAHS